jgi:hypothetical protein
MMRNVKLLGIIALVAVMGCFMISCGEDTSTPAPSGPVHIWDEYGPYINYELEAIYVQDAEQGDPDYVIVEYLWFKASDQAILDVSPPPPVNYTAAKTYILAEGSTYTPTVEGSYTVAVVDNTAGNWTTFKNSTTDGTMPDLTFTVKSIAIGQPDTNITAYYGDWKTTTTFQPSGSAANTKALEFITITYRSFSLDSTWDGDKTTAHDGTNLTIDNLPNGHEYWYYEIHNWKSITSTPQGYSDWKRGYTLTGKRIETKGYEGTATTFNLWQNADGDTFLRTTTNNAPIGTPVRLYQK